MRSGGDNRGRLLLVILIVTSLFLITLDLRGVQLLDGVRSGTQSAFSPVQKFASNVTKPARDFFGDVARLGRTRSEIERLKAENENLKTKLINRKAADAELSALKSTLDLAGRAGYKVVAARVIAQGSTTSFSQTITIDAGTADGIRDNQTVICGLGLVGVIKQAYSNSALVQLASDPGFKIGARIAGSQQIGILSGQGTRTAFLELLDNASTVKEGDVILARGSENNRPFVPGVPIGRVTSTDNAAGSVTESAEIKFFANFSKLAIVSVVLGATAGDPRDALVPEAPRPTPIPTVTIYANPSPSASVKP
jgi:rod shape-determining protein MreC